VPMAAVEPEAPAVEPEAPAAVEPEPPAAVAAPDAAVEPEAAVEAPAPAAVAAPAVEPEAAAPAAVAAPDAAVEPEAAVEAAAPDAFAAPAAAVEPEAAVEPLVVNIYSVPEHDSVADDSSDEAEEAEGSDAEEAEGSDAEGSAAEGSDAEEAAAIAPTMPVSKSFDIHHESGYWAAKALPCCDTLIKAICDHNYKCDGQNNVDIAIKIARSVFPKSDCIQTVCKVFGPALVINSAILGNTMQTVLGFMFHLMNQHKHAKIAVPHLPEVSKNFENVDPNILSACFAMFTDHHTSVKRILFC
jgi:hypothetical protein